MSVKPGLPQFHPYLDKEAEREFKRFFKWTGEEVWRKKILNFEQAPRLSKADFTEIIYMTVILWPCASSITFA